MNKDELEEFGKDYAKAWSKKEEWGQVFDL